MPKKPDQTNPKCPHCSTPTLKNGNRKIKQRIYQRYKCKSCNQYFTSQSSLQKSKTYALKTILESISDYNLGKSLRTITKSNQIPKSTIHNWIKQLKTDLPFNRLQNRIKSNPIKKVHFIHHKQPFLYQYHTEKLEFAKRYPALILYLTTIFNTLQKNIFQNSERISQQKPIQQNIKLIEKQNYATKLANIVLQITSNNSERHQIIENFMLINDTATLATEIPLYLKEQNLTGHIDILQIRFHNIHILDYKPEPINEQQAITQLLLYRKALSQLTKISEKRIRIAYFNDKGYYEMAD